MSRFIIWFFICFLSTFSIVYLYYKISLSSRKLDFKFLLAFLTGVVLSFLIEYYKLEVLSYVSYFLYFPLMFYYIKRMPIKKIFFYLMVIWFLGIFFDLIAMFIIALIRSFCAFDIYGYIFECSLTIFVSLMLFLVANFKRSKTMFNNMYINIHKIKFLDISLMVYAFFTLITGVVIFINLRNLNINILLTLVIFLVVIIFLLLMKVKIADKENITYLKNLKENNEFYIKMEEENRIFKHNLVAKLLSIKSVSNKKAMSLIEDLILQFNKSIDFSQKMKVIPYGLNGIIYQKLYSYMKILNIEISNELDYDVFEILKPRRYNVFVEKLVIALDNAIESCLNSDSKSLVINIYDDNNSVCIEIENTFGNNIDLDLLGNKDYSTKGKKHGLGLFSAFRNNEAILSVKIINNIFVSKIVAKKHLVD